MLISPQQARDLLAELTRTCPMRLAVAALGTRGFHHHGHVFFGDTALEGHKAKNRWWFVADEVEKAAAHWPACGSNRMTSSRSPYPSDSRGDPRRQGR